jgi:hypothetical protein
MGYYIQTINSTARIPQQNLQKAYEVMCALNQTHDHVKRGGSWSGGKQAAKWFSWMDADYPSKCADAAAILGMLGFETQYNDQGDLLITHYDNKTGQEDLFLKSIKNLTTGSIVWQGEEGESWTTEFYGDQVVEMPQPTKLIGY